jgi:L-cysteine:1D-myo-inositol 2-amino-2-deoxy-alpha-D-glucopyranoside ligase
VAYPAADGQHSFARVYAHSGMVAYQGQKMSKSLGNLVFVSRLRVTGTDPMAIRLALLAHHYRSDWEWTDTVLEQAHDRLARWREAVRAIRTTMDGQDLTAGPDAGGADPAGGAVAPSARGVLQEVRGRLADDLDAPGALDVIDSWSAAVLSGAAAGAEDAVLIRDTADALLGVVL